MRRVTSTPTRRQLQSSNNRLLHTKTLACNLFRAMKCNGVTPCSDSIDISMNPNMQVLCVHDTGTFQAMLTMGNTLWHSRRRLEMRKSMIICWNTELTPTYKTRSATRYFTWWWSQTKRSVLVYSHASDVIVFSSTTMLYTTRAALYVATSWIPKIFNNYALYRF